MPTLLDLPSEIILKIVSCLPAAWLSDPDYSNDWKGLPVFSDAHDSKKINRYLRFSDWTRRLRENTMLGMESNEDVFMLMQTCTRLLDLLRPILHQNTIMAYSRLDKRRKGPYKCHWRLHDMPPLRSLSKTPVVRSWIKNLTIAPGYDEHAKSRITLGLLELTAIFNLPCLQTLTIQGFAGTRGEEIDKVLRDGFSSVNTLQLPRCEASEEEVAYLLQLPHTLKELAYERVGDVPSTFNEVVFISDDGEYSGTAKLNEALRKHVITLDTLTITREDTFLQEPWFPRMQLHDFTALTTLRILSSYLIGNDSNNELEKALPKSLQILEVTYDTGTSYRLQSHKWLRKIATKKRRAYPNLRRITMSDCASGFKLDFNEAPPINNMQDIHKAVDTISGIELKLVDDFRKLGVELTLPAETDPPYGEFDEQESIAIGKYDYSDESENHGDTSSGTDEEMEDDDEDDSDDEGNEDDDDSDDE